LAWKAQLDRLAEEKEIDAGKAIEDMELELALVVKVNV
jgi:hypothetical protein